MNSAEKNKDTKEKILEVANDLFAKNGFEGTSVRDIASQADVNLSAINYHFKNKENLYWKVFDNNYNWMDAGIKKLGQKKITTVELAVEVFRFFVANGPAMMNTFKIFLSDNVTPPTDALAVDRQERFGPPGQEVFLEKLIQDLGDEIPLKGQQWAIKMIFSQLVHFGVVLNTTVMKEKCKMHKEMGPEGIEEAIYHSVQAQMNYLKSNAQLFK